MARSRFGPGQSPVQLRTLNKRRQQKDNSDLMRKVALRRRVCRDLKQADIFLAGSGFGQMYRHAWRDKARYTLALDTNPRKVDELQFQFPTVDARLGDFTTFGDWPTNRRFQIADFDAFGDLYPGMAHFFSMAPWTTPFYVVVGDGAPLAYKRAGHLSPHLAPVGNHVPVLGTRDLDTYVNGFVWPWWERTAAAHGLAIEQRAWLSNREKSLAYYAIRLDALY